MFKLLKNISIYSFGSILSTGVSFFLLPLYTRILSPADYGQLELIYLVGLIFSIIYGLKISNGYGRIYFINKDVSFRKTLFFTGQIFSIICFSVFILILFTNINWFATKLFKFENGDFFLKIISLAILFEVLTQIPLNNLRIRYKAIQYISASLVNLLVTVIFTIFFITILNFGVKGIIYGKMIGSLTTLFFLYSITWKEFHFKFSSQYLWQMLSFSFFLIPVDLSSIILNMSNRYFLQEYKSLGDVGIYALSAKIAAVISLLLIEPVKKAFIPLIFEKAVDSNESKFLLSNFIRYFFVSLSIIVLTLSLYSSDIIYFMADKSYYSRGNIVFILSISYLVLGTSDFIALAVQITRKTWIISLIWLLSSPLNIVLNIFLIPIYGREGAAYATLISVIFIFLLYVYASYRVFPLNIQFIRLSKVLLLLILFYILGSKISFNFYINIICKFLVISLYFVVIIMFSNVIEKSEIEYFFSKIKNKFKKVDHYN